MKVVKPIFYLLLLLNSTVLLGSQWTQLADFGGSARHRASGLVIGNKAYVGSGHINGTGQESFFNDWWEYDPATNGWTQKADIPMTVDSTFLQFSSIMDMCGVEINGVGYFNRSTGFPSLKYSPATNSWTVLDSSGYENTPNSTCKPLHFNGKGYFHSSSGKLGIYDPLTNQWSDHPNFSYPDNNVITWKNVYSMDSTLYFSSYILGSPLGLWTFNVSTNQWSSVGEWVPQFSDEIIFEHSGHIIAACGGWPQATDIVYSYDPINNSWMQLEAFPGAMRRYGVGFTLNGVGYMTTGTNGVNLQDLWRMDNTLMTSEIDNHDFETYPNPTIDYFEIKSQNEKNFSFELSNSLGTIVQTGRTNDGNIKVERGTCPKGTYSIRLSTQKGISTVKTIVFI